MGTTLIRTLAAVVLASACLAACTSVRTIAPLQGLPVPEDALHLEGTWAGPDMAFHVGFDAEGRGRFAGFVGLTAVQGGLHAVRGESANYLSLDVEWVFPDSLQWWGYELLSYSFTDDGSLQLAWADTEAFAKAVTADELAGEVKGEGDSREILLTGSPSSVLQHLEGRERRELFKTGSATTLRRIEGP